jgi:putative endonuclease
MEKRGYVYIITNKPFGTLYIGVTSNLIQRITQHHQKLVDGFSKANNLDKLVYYENHDSIEAAILREKAMKEWKRNWKIRAIMDENPEWHDLYSSLM